MTAKNNFTFQTFDYILIATASFLLIAAWCYIIILNGTKDIQVTIKEAKALHEANKNSELVIIENMNHVLKEILKDEDNIKSYYSADYTISSQLIETIVSFIKK